MLFFLAWLQGWAKYQSTAKMNYIELEQKILFFKKVQFEGNLENRMARESFENIKSKSESTIVKCKI